MSDNKVEVFCINPNEQKVSQVAINGLLDMYKIMDCQQIERISGNTLANHLTEWWSIDDLFVDEEALTGAANKPQGQQGFSLQSFGGFTHLIYGNSLVLGTDSEGDTLSPSIKKSDLEKMIVWQKDTPWGEEAVQPEDFSGSDYDPAIDFVRLKGQMLRVYACLQPRNEWWTLREIEEETGDPQASISAQLRNLRKEKFGSHTIERRRRASCVDTTGSTIVGGQWEYRLNDGLVFECHQCDGKFAEEEVNRQWTHDPYATGDSPSVFEYTCPSCGSFYINECDRQQG